jgi:choline dehydrogenase-like flavoprotein
MLSFLAALKRRSSAASPPHHTYRAQALVIGSGAGGAVAAYKLAAAGRAILVLEEGPEVAAADYGKWRPTQTFRRMARQGGSTVAIGLGDSPTINLLTGMAVGGSSTLTGGVCFRIPGEVHEEWVNHLNDPTLSAAEMERFYQEIESISRVQEVPVASRSRSTVLFGEGAQRLGLEMKSLRRNTDGCVGSSRCNFGCPKQAKLSVDLTFLPKARALGAEVKALHRTESLILDGDRVVGARGVVLEGANGGWHPVATFEARADVVVVAAGTIHSPLLLQASGLGKASGQVGRNLTLHPSFRMMARFDEPVRAWRGALQSAYINEGMGDERLILVSAFAPPNILAAAMHGVGPSLMAGVQQMPHMATFGGMVHDDAGGRVWRGPGREPVVTYRLSPRDKAAMFEGLRWLARCFFEAGARQVIPPVFGMKPLNSPDDVQRLDAAQVPAARVESLSFHPLGTCRMGKSAAEAVTDTQGRVFGVKGLWIADGSVLPTSVGVNTQIPIMTMAARVAANLLGEV